MKVTAANGGEWAVATTSGLEWKASTERCRCRADQGEFDACSGPVEVTAPTLEELYVAIEEAEEFHFGPETERAPFGLSAEQIAEWNAARGQS